ENVTPADYREYGRERKEEARVALHTLGFANDALTFLGFPNGGLGRLVSAYWSERHPPYQSPYTRRDRPAKSEVLEKDTKFRGEDLTQELALVIGRLRPTIILVPRKEDQHVDHCAAWFFVGDALNDVTRVDPAFHTDVVTYIIHFESWPFDDDTPDISPGPGGWLRVRLTDQEMKTKLEAISKYKTQMKVMDWFLEA